MADEHETESQAWAIEAAAAEAASRAAEEVHRPPVVPMERVVDRTDIERGERAGQKRSREPGFPETFSFDATNVILDAIESQTQNPGQSLKEIVLARQQFNGVQRPITFDRNGDTLGKTFMVRIENGAFAPIRK